MNLSKKWISEILILLLIILLAGGTMSAQESKGSVIARAGTNVHSVAYTPDGKLFIACYENKVVTWNTETNTVVSVYDKFTSPVVSGKLSRDGKWYLTVCKDNSILLRNLQNESQNITLNGTSSLPVLDLDFLENGYNMIIPLDGQNLTRCFRLMASGEIDKKDFAQLNSPVYAVTSFPAEKKVIAATSDGIVRVFDSNTGTELMQFQGSAENKVKPAFNRSGKSFIAAKDKNHLAIRTISGGREQIITDSDQFVNAAVFSPDGKKVAAALKSGNVKIYDITTGKKEYEFKLSESGDVVESLIFSPDGKTILAGTFKGYLHRWGLKAKPAGDKDENTETSAIVSDHAIVKELAVHDDVIDVVFGFNTLSEGFGGSYNIGAAYRRYEFNPIYLTFDASLGFGFPGRDFKYKYYVGSRQLNDPVLYSLLTSCGGGGCYYFDEKDILLFAETRTGLNLRTLCNNDFYGFILESPSFGVYLDFVTGVQWQHARFDIGCHIDSNLGAMFKIEIAVSQKWKKRSRS